MKNYLYILCLSLVISIMGCKDPYSINIAPTDLNVLVVEGQIGADNSTSYVYLSRSLNLNDHSTFLAEENAEIFVEDEASFRQQLFYNASNKRYERVLNTVIGNKYRVSIKTIDGNSYISEYEELINTPEIGDITNERVFDGLTFKINTEDPTNNAKYFRWTFEEDWEINSVYQTSVWYDAENIRLVDSNMYDAFVCYKNNLSTSIILATTENVNNSKLIDHIFHKVPAKDDRFTVKYSMLVKQYAISKEAYMFLDIMRKNTESLGSIFDPQPSESIGNIVCITNPDIKVLGFIQASVEKSKRIYIRPSEVENWGFTLGCTMYNVPKQPDSMRSYFPGMYLPLEDANPIPSATSNCVDCKLRGGNNNKPIFW